MSFKLLIAICAMGSPYLAINPRKFMRSLVSGSLVWVEPTKRKFTGIFDSVLTSCQIV